MRRESRARYIVLWPNSMSLPREFLMIFSQLLGSFSFVSLPVLCWQTFFLSYTLSWPLLKWLITVWLQAQSQTQDPRTQPCRETHSHGYGYAQELSGLVLWCDEPVPSLGPAFFAYIDLTLLRRQLSTCEWLWLSEGPFARSATFCLAAPPPTPCRHWLTTIRDEVNN